MDYIFMDYTFMDYTFMDYRLQITNGWHKAALPPIHASW